MLALLGVLAGLSAISSVAKARGARQQGNYEGDLLNMNAGLLDMQSKDALTRGAESANRYRSDVRQVVGSQRTSMAAQGIDVSDGTAAQIVSDTETLGELDALTIQNNARRESWGYAVQAADLRARAKGARYAGKMASYQSLLSGGVQMAGMAYGAKR